MREMMIQDKDKWQHELLIYGRIVNDADTAVSSEEAEFRFNIYIELLDAVSGEEGEEAAQAIVKSIQVEDDYGAYQSAFNALDRFPPNIQVAAYISELPRLLESFPDRAGEILCRISNQFEVDGGELVECFNRQLMCLDRNLRQLILTYIRQEENGGWLDHRKGILGAEKA